MRATKISMNTAGSWKYEPTPEHPVGSKRFFQFFAYRRELEDALDAYLMAMFRNDRAKEVEMEKKYNEILDRPCPWADEISKKGGEE